MTDDPITAMLLNTTDPQIWAWEFLELVEAGATIDEGLMIAWFSNAIAAGRMNPR